MNDIFGMINEIVRLGKSTDELNKRTDLNTLLAAQEMASPQRQLVADTLYPDEPNRLLGIIPTGGVTVHPMKKRIMSMPDAATIQGERLESQLAPILAMQTRAHPEVVQGIQKFGDKYTFGGDTYTADQLLHPQYAEDFQKKYGEVDEATAPYVGFAKSLAQLGMNNKAKLQSFVTLHKLGVGGKQLGQMLGIQEEPNSLGDYEARIVSGKATPLEVENYKLVKSMGRQVSPYDEALAAAIQTHGAKAVGEMLLQGKQVPMLNYGLQQDKYADQTVDNSYDRQLKALDDDRTSLTDQERILARDEQMTKDQIAQIPPAAKISSNIFKPGDIFYDKAVEYGRLQGELVKTQNALREVGKGLLNHYKTRGEFIKQHDLDENQRKQQKGGAAGTLPTVSTPPQTDKSKVKPMSPEETKAYLQSQGAYDESLIPKSLPTVKTPPTNGNIQTLPFDNSSSRVTPQDRDVFAQYVKDKVRDIISSIDGGIV